MASSSSRIESRTKDYYTTKAGRIAIFNGENYTEFASTCQAALVISGAWNFVTGEEHIVRNSSADAIKRRNEALKLIYNSVESTYQLRIKDSMTALDPPGMWETIKAADRTLDPVYTGKLLKEFRSTTFDPSSSTIGQFVRDLEWYKMTLSTSDRPLRDTDIRQQLLEALPVDTEWNNARIWCERDKLDLQACITLLQSSEPIRGRETAATATNTRGRGNGTRGRGRGRGRGSKKGHNQRSTSRSGSRVSKGDQSRKAGRDECRVCFKKGHFMKDCEELKKVQSKLWEKNKQGTTQQEAEQVESSNVALAEETDSDSLYYSPYAMIATIEPVWILDSGASKHFSGTLSDFTQLKRWALNRAVRIANNATVPAEGHGIASVGDLQLKDVWFVPQFKSMRLLSVRKLAQEGYTILFEGDQAICKKGNMVLFKATARNGTYAVIDTPGAFSVQHQQPQDELNTPTLNTEIELWHRRLAHTNLRDVEKLEHSSIGMKLKKRVQLVGRHACEACLVGKRKESFNKTTSSRSSDIGQRLHGDTSGRMGRSIRGYNYFLLVVDDASRYTWIRLLKTLTTAEVLPALLDILLRIENHTGKKPAQFRADNGKGEFGTQFQRELAYRGTTFEPCPPYKHSFNGTAERAIYTVDCKARSILFEAGLPPEYWCFCVEHAIWVKNRVPTSALPFEGPIDVITPFEAYAKRVPDLQKLVIFGCYANPGIPLQKHPQKMASRVKTDYIFIGMERSKVYKLMNLQTNQVETYGDANFNEYKFPFAERRRITQSRAPTEPRRPLPTIPTRTRDSIQGIQAAAGGGEGAPARVHDTGRPTVRDSVARPAVQEVEGSSTSIPHNQPTRSGRWPNMRVFNDTVVQLVTAMKAVHLGDNSTSLGAPTAPFEAIELEAAMQEDAPGWRNAIHEELSSLLKMNTFTIMRGRVPQGRQLLPTRLVLRKKFNTRGDVIRLKARLCIRGDKQTAGIDYFETFASVVRYDTLRFLLAKVAAEDLEIDHIDVNTAFLNPTLKEDIYMEIPQFLDELIPELRGSQAYVKLNKALYGLKQAPREWFFLVKTFFEDLGLKSSTADPNLFTGRGVYILLFVDDMLIAGKRTQVDLMKAKIMTKWTCKDLGPAELFVGFQISRERSNRTLKLHQTFYTTKLLERMHMHKANPTSLPIPAGTVLKTDTALLRNDDITVYQQIVGSAIYLANCTRPDISYAVGQLARFMAKPGISHYRLCKHLLRYLNGTRTTGILYSRLHNTPPNSYDIYTDATWGTEEDRISFQGMAVRRYGGVISWSAQRQKSIALSSMEAEIMAATEGGRETAWLEKLTTELGERHETTPFVPTLFCDNQGAVDLLHDTKFHRKAKHIEIRYMFVRTEMVQKGRLKVVHIEGKHQPADILTKQLPIDQFKKHCRTLGLVE